MCKIFYIYIKLRVENSNRSFPIGYLQVSENELMVGFSMHIPH